ncbi:MAG: type II toxin-antitoxin system Phd/YefM family antitoxin [Myxococcaceae bacterium]|nr:type II toxin-antitoxin system Phd/YefM family antitoxin [Myxococcaceae bacterium]
MRPAEISRDFLPIAKFKARASEVIQRVRRENRPMVITLNGEPAAVVISPHEYDRIIYAERVRSAIDEGLAAEAAGDTISDEEFEMWAKKRFGAFAKQTTKLRKSRRR